MPINNPGGQESQTGSGIYGAMVAVRGNAPANPPSRECVKVYDASGRKLLATAICSGPMASFRLPLAAGSYVVEAGGRWESVNGRIYFRPNRRRVELGVSQWVKLGPQPPPGPLP